MLYVRLLACLVAVSTYDILNMAHNVPPPHVLAPPRCAFVYSVLLAYCCVYRRCDVDGITGAAARQLVCAARLIVVFALICVLLNDCAEV